MAARDMVPWRWGGLRRREHEDHPARSFYDEIDSLHRDMDRLFESVWSGGLGGLTPISLTRHELMPQLDVTEDENAYCVKADLPGIDENDIDITLSDRRLTIRGEKKEDKETNEKDVYRRERSYGQFSRSIEVPTAVDVEKIAASFEKGVLKVTLPKTEDAKGKAKRIEIKSS